MTPVRVGFVVHVMQVAGAEVLIREAIRRLGAAIEPTIFCLDRVGPIGEELRAEGVAVECLDRRPGWDFSIPRKLARAATARRIEVLHAHQYTPFFYAALAKPLIRPTPRLILTEHGRHYPDVVSPHRRAINRLVFDRLADDITACCVFAGRALCKVDGFRGNRIAVVPNGIATEKYGPPADKSPYKARLGLDPARRYLLHVARHHPVKDQPTLLRGFASVASQVPDADLVLVGDGPRRGELEQLAADLGITGRTHFLGVRPDIPDVLRAADVFVLTSLSEAASLTVLEAMASGLPVIATAVGGNPELVRDGVDGLLFPRGDHAACGVAIRRLFADPAFAADLGASGHARANREFRLDATVDAFFVRYRRLAGR